MTFLVGETGFEPATLRSQSECATGLRYSPFRKMSNIRDFTSQINFKSNEFFILYALPKTHLKSLFHTL